MTFEQFKIKTLLDKSRDTGTMPKISYPVLLALYQKAYPEKVFVCNDDRIYSENPPNNLAM